MGSEEVREKIFQIFKDFMASVTKLEELGTFGSRLLSDSRQVLELLRRPPINRTSKLIHNIIKANETKRVKSYIAAGCINNHDLVQNMSKSKSTLNELESLMEDVADVMKTANGCLSLPLGEYSCDEFDQKATTGQEEDESPPLQRVELTDYATLMAIIYSMVKQDHVMQERIATSLSLKTSSGELESYCLMWSLQPFIDDEIMHRAWKLIP
ncbi:uncharacterized protein LOC119985701 isoform X2 [Tripterygium wilfordii]|uniref:uncharacterized protein LOC119985701 isoform X2 n=1 Tax=Tripterygium wilfordii TaxID=458696 RepID=UPI0018F85F15|nr:uncharacterized protein LOC119985701 isoform X2 [Tripterygium wilfordii]